MRSAVAFSVVFMSMVVIVWGAVVFFVFRSIDTAGWSLLQRMLLFAPMYVCSLLVGWAAARVDIAWRRRRRRVVRGLMERYQPCDYHGGGKAEVGVFGDGTKGWLPATHVTAAHSYCDECVERLCAAGTYRRVEFRELDSAAAVRAAMEELQP